MTDLAEQQAEAIKAARQAEAIASARAAQSGPTVLGTFGDGGRVVMLSDGTRSAVSPGGSTSDPETIDRLMAGETFSAIVQQDMDQQRIAQNPVAARANEVVRGVPFIGSFADEAVGLVSPSAAENMRATTGAMQRENPGQTMGLNVAGGVLGAVPMALAAAPGIAAAAPATRGAQAVAGLALGATAGGIEGGIYGAGEGTDQQTRTDEAQSGAVVGAGIGGVLGAAAPYAAAGMKNLTNWLRNSDVNVIQTALGIGQPAAMAIRNALGTGNPDNAMTAVRRAGDDAMLADASIPGRKLLDGAAQAPGPSSTIVNDAVSGRARDAGDAITRVMDDILGVPQGQNELITEVRTGSAPARQTAYDAAYAQPIDYANDSGRALEAKFRRIPASAWRRADALMQLDGDSSMQRMVQIGDDGTVTLSSMPDVRQLDYITRALNDVAAEADGSGKLGGTTDLGRSTANLSRQIRQDLRRAVPEYATALDTAASAIGERNAIETGYTLLNTGTRREDVIEALSGASAAERRAAQQGVRAYIDDTMATVTRTMGNPDTDIREAMRAVRDISSRANRTKIRTLLGDARGNRLLDEVDRAATAFELRQAVAEGSQTAGRLAVQAGVDAIGEGGILRTVKRGEGPNAAKRLIQAITGETPEAAQLRQMGLFEDIARALTEIRGEEAATTLRIIQGAMAREGRVTENQARRISALLLTADVAGARAVGFQNDGRTDRTRQ